jgi:hypothetical protein
VPEEDPGWSMCYSRICSSCHVGGSNKNSNDADEENMTLAEFGRAHANNKKRSSKKTAVAVEEPQQKKQKRFARPVANYEDDPTEDPSSWTFPDNRPEYFNTFLEFMSFIDNKTYTRILCPTFTKERLLSLQPKHVLAFLTHKAFGKSKRTPEDRPKYGRSNHIKNIKMKLSHYMPSATPWVDSLTGGRGHGNPTKHKSINMLIADIIQFEIREEGAGGQDVRDMTVEELEKELELFRQQSK